MEVVLLLLVVLGVVWLIRQRKKYAVPQVPVPDKTPPIKAPAKNARKPAEPDCPFCLDVQENEGFGAFENYERYRAVFEKATDATSCGKAVLDRLDALVEAAPLADHELLTEAIEECFFQQCASKHPVAVMRLFDKMQQEHPCMAFALRHGGLDEMVAAFCESLSNPLPEKGRAKTIVGLLQSDHPLVKGALASSAADVADWLDGECEEFWPDWEACTHNDMSPEDFIAGVLACLKGEKDPSSL